MKNLLKGSLSGYSLAWIVLAAGCTRASFVSVEDDAGTDKDGGHPGPGTDSSPGPEARATCPAPEIACSGGTTSGICDPVCQTGGCDWCSQKCTYAGSGAQPVCAGKGQKAFAQACAVLSSGSAQQSDDCAPGSICLAPTIGDNLTVCFALCRSAADCPYGVECGQRKLSAAGGMVGVCDPPYDQCGQDGKCCDPLAGSGCPSSRTCLLVSPDGGSGHSRTVCEFGYGDGRNSSPCDSSRDCLPRNTCVHNTCRQICASGSPCPGGGACTPLGSEYGYCPS